jgi:hypothetical protein
MDNLRVTYCYPWLQTVTEVEYGGSDLITNDTLRTSKIFL